MTDRTSAIKARDLEKKIREGIARFGLTLAPGAYFKGLSGKSPRCCAVGGALAFSVNTKAALMSINRSGVDTYSAPAAIGNGLTMAQARGLEVGFEKWVPEHWAPFDWSFYRLGRKLRREADAKAKEGRK
ncbi:MAG: hypothetical protein EPN98_21785 [Phenylobacterium sp.]|uniref:hypothetical protein n=1 Tax=Phenylobacterium sp. TaxID=1871053 RepID=UPI0012078FE9|nr:hypothetical protein [Phenylobacterium sp.]TAL29075.1 MAG: hypothetical protein EPN98_21785 [Phenylobacterium sp.]